jgi:hypothetical protein
MGQTLALPWVAMWSNLWGASFEKMKGLSIPSSHGGWGPAWSTLVRRVLTKKEHTILCYIYILHIYSGKALLFINQLQIF